MVEKKILFERNSENIYDFKDEESSLNFIREKEGLDEEVIRRISKEKNEPKWMLDFRLKSLKIYNELEMPNWGPAIDGLDMDKIVTYVKSKTPMQAQWEDVPEDIKNTFEKLGIPKAERKSLASVPQFEKRSC